MGVVVVQIGQGGNQMGYALFECLASMAVSPPTEFFRSAQPHSAAVKARAVLVDMEPKVIQGIVKRAKTAAVQAHRSAWTYDAQRLVAQNSGSGNNWARGYYGHGPQCLDSVLDAIRLEVEQCDVFGGFVILQSLAGGTGAGLGAYLVEALRDEYPSSFILSHCIWPYESGEVIVQNYNVLLTLSHLQSFADGVIIVQNEQLSAICRTLLGVLRPSFDDINEVAVEALGCALLPSYWRTVQPSTQTIQTDVVPAQSLDFTNFTWAAQLKHLRQMLITGAHKELEMDWNVKLPTSSVHEHKRGVFPTNGHHQINRSLANLLILRGSGSDNADVSDFADVRMYPIWQVDPLSVAACSTSYGRYEIAAGLLSNCQSSVLPASRALTRAYNMFASKAFLHQYFEHGMEAASFDGAFASIEDLVTRYSLL
ncbi:hypothetical protein AXG93_2415s1520 [Marchantia polymorpha subsp. ruderalis]|uniref:Tubulin delta chain n=1 Tax=Marchantia polymorpha subsp. ruderalis TaxID=1480154 RepID=A0A176VUU2_MARPO|nr:hypothetical protein AXG93_2415s1520 [Marchantia polymorpha subsp. ruderalis]